MKALLHPTYFPTIASFSLLVTTPCVLEVSDNYQKQTYRNRTYIYGANGKQILTVPILHTGGETGRQLYKDVRVDNQVAWQKLHWKHTFLLDLNLRTIEVVLDCLHKEITWEKTTTYEPTYEGLSDCRYLTNAKEAYQVDQAPYYQIFSDKHGFIANLSILDLLFHEGNQTISLMTRDK